MRLHACVYLFTYAVPNVQSVRHNKELLWIGRRVGGKNGVGREEGSIRWCLNVCE